MGILEEMTRNVMDNRFEQSGVILQMDANSWEAAKERYNNSCMLCCTREGGVLKCANCRIRGAFLSNAKVFRKKLSKEDRLFIEDEKALR